MPGDLYERLSEPFDVTFTDVRGGVSLTYITGEQVVSRLNEVLGVAGWSFRILDHGINAEADECWVLGELTARFDDSEEKVSIVKQQFGSQKLHRSRSSGAPLDIGFDLKGATTDAMKKCASLLGVGLYLSKKKASPQRSASVQQSRPTGNGTQSQDHHRSRALSDWNETCERAKKAGIEVKAIPDNATADQLQRWTELLNSRIEEHRQSQPADAVA